MDLLRISRKFWRYRIVTLPIIALTLLGAFYVIAIKAPVYKVSSSYVLINPPPPPTADEIARNPALGRVNSDNPYTRFSDQSVIVSLLSSSLSSDTTRQQLVSQGADPRYTVAPDLQLGYSSLVVEVTGVGTTPESAVKTAELVGAGLTSRARPRAGVSGRGPPVHDPHATRGRPRQPDAAGVEHAPAARRCARDRGDLAAAGHLGSRGAGHRPDRMEQARRA